MKDRKILLTGAGGFIGSHLVAALASQGASVRAFVHYNSSSTAGWLDRMPDLDFNRVEIVRGDIRDSHGVRKAVEDVDTVFHLAALIGIPYSYHSPDSYVETNVRGTLNLLQAAREAQVSRFIHTSTSEVYGTALSVPISEEHRLNAQSPYAATKIAADQLALSYYASFGLPVGIIRPFNTYGPRQSTRAVIPTIISQLASGKREIHLGALAPTRDFCFVEDTVRGFLAAADSESFAGEVVNIGTGFEISVGDTAKLIASLMQVDVSITEEAQRVRPSSSEVERLCADNSKAKRVINWQPKYEGKSGFERGLEQTINWFTQVENLRLFAHDRYTV